MLYDHVNIIERKLQEIGGPKPTLIAVSKMQSDQRVDEALSLGLRQFGENRVQEAETRWSERRKTYPDLALHLIGPLQSNKVADAVALFDVIHSVDRIKLVDALAAEMERQDRQLPCFIQVNTGEESQKAGVLPQDLEVLIQQARIRKLNVIGLMCIPPVGDVPALHFALLKTLAARHGLTGLSMGMSDDYEAAAKLGATHLRIGSAIFGARDENQT
jgi:PLP dependent protein